MKNKRKYSYKDVVMLLACKTIVQNFAEHMAELAVARSNWTDDYATQLGAKVDNAIDKYLGLDKKQELRNASSRLYAIQVPALRDLSFFKGQLEVDFNNEQDLLQSILIILGFTQGFRGAQTKKQETLIQLLHAFKKGMNDEMREQLTGKGMNNALIDRIISYADQVILAEVSQETLKEKSKKVSAEAVQVFNDIFVEVMGVCKIASLFYRGEALKKSLFTFSKVAANMSAHRSVTDYTDNEQPDAA